MYKMHEEQRVCWALMI